MTELPTQKAFQGAVMTDLPVFLRHASTVPASWDPARRRGFPFGAARALKALAAAFRRWRARERAVAELARLDDGMLADLGLHRSEIRSAVLDAETPGGARVRRRAR